MACTSIHVMNKYYYVRKGATGNNTGTDWKNAWTDINFISIVSGDIIYIAAGTYTGTYTTDTSGWTLKRAAILEHGTNTGWNNSYDGLVKITGSSDMIVINNHNNIVIDGVDKTKFELDGANSAGYGIIGYGAGTHSIIIKNASLHNFYHSAINFGLYGGFSNNIEIAYCEIYKNGTAAGHDTEGCIILSYAAALGYGRNKVHHNYMHDAGKTANIGATDLMTGNINYTDIYNNHFDSGWSPDWGSSDMTHISGNENRIFNNIYETTGWNQNVFIHTENPAARIPTNNYVFNNIFYKPSSNVLYGALNIYAYNTGTIRNLYVYNNVFYGHAFNVLIGKEGTGTIEGLIFKNNIFWPNSTMHKAIQDDAGTFDSGNLTLDYNYYYTVDSLDVLYKGSGNLNLEELQAIGSELNGGNGGNPGFSSISNANGFYLTSSSPFPVRDGGYNLSSIFTTDKDGKPRGADGNWDIGAYEYTPECPTPIVLFNLNIT